MAAPSLKEYMLDARSRPTNDHLSDNQIQGQWITDWSDEYSQRDSAVSFSVDQAQKMAGAGLRAIGDFSDNDPIRKAGQRFMDQQDYDIKEGNYSSSYEGSILDNYEAGGIDQAIGKTWEAMQENFALTGTALVGGAATAVASPFSVPLATFITAGTVATTGLMGAGETALEMENKGVEVSSGKALLGGAFISVMDRIGVTKLIPSASISKMTGSELMFALVKVGAKDKAKAVAKEIVKRTSYEVGTELAQETAIVGAAVSEGATYTQDEIINRVVDTAVISAGMSGPFSAGGIAGDYNDARKYKADHERAAGINNYLTERSRKDGDAAAQSEADNGGDALDQEMARAGAEEVYDADIAQSSVVTGKTKTALDDVQNKMLNEARDSKIEAEILAAEENAIIDQDDEYDRRFDEAQDSLAQQQRAVNANNDDQADADYRAEQESKEVYSAIHNKAKGRTSASLERVATQRAADQAELERNNAPVRNNAIADALNALNLQKEEVVKPAPIIQPKEKPITGFDNERTTSLSVDEQKDLLKERGLMQRKQPKVDPKKDNIQQAINKLGGVSLASTDSQDVGRNSMFRKKAGMTMDDMAEALSQDGYLDVDEHGKADIKQLQALMDKQLAGENVYAKSYYDGTRNTQNQAEEYYGREYDEAPVGEGELIGMNDLDMPPETNQDLDNVAITKAAKEAAHSEDNSLDEPTDAQKEAGNYKKGHVSVQGLNISIENPKGSTRKGVSEKGDPWSVEMTSHYGYIKGTVGKDKDHVDVFLADKAGVATKAFVVDQVDPDTGVFDEHKVVIGVDTVEQATAEYNNNYSKGWKGAGAVTEMSMDEFKGWVNDKAKTQKPAGKLENKKKVSNDNQKKEADTQAPSKEKAKTDTRQDAPVKKAEESISEKSIFEVKKEAKDLDVDDSTKNKAELEEAIADRKESGKPLSDIMFTTEDHGRRSAEFYLKQIDDRLDALNQLQEIC